MRDLLIFGIVLWGLSKVFSKAHVGVYLWTWISLMNPHRLTWGYAFSFPFAMVIGVATFVGLLTSRQPRMRIWTPETAVLALLIFWVTCTTFLFAIDPEGAFQEWDRYMKIQTFIFLSILLISDKAKLDGLIWIFVLSLGYYGTKGGLFTILTGGHSRVWGPDGSFIGGNNEIALAMLMTVPLMRYLHLQETRVWFKRGLLAAMVLTMVAIIGTQSRGALLGLLAIGFFLWLKSPKKLGMAIIVVAVGMMILFLMPQEWWDRMNTIHDYDQDASAQGRINAWWVATRVAMATFTGGGANMFTPAVFRLYAPNPDDFHDVHSIYFEMLGEQGFPGITLFLLLGFLFWRRCSLLIRTYRHDPERRWAADLGAMLQVAGIGYAVAGAFLGLSYYDYYYDLVAAAVIAWQVAAKDKAAAVAVAVAAEAEPPPQHRHPHARRKFSP
ncbi:MAG TPA: putative O-glycosylation ligase, exosortase A system-associated [Thiobacillaceae bacterium]|nr:putative O-glycosylation ligase, exosortase A system-associated [Thiobacillaceae bacterium]HNF87999.1 putative O-glycosylation ligase, exosortase A system-associated [Thiobacillaceae bacterium]HNH88102.1 putative O-glycosylation ligase, exosortase A system-associated [Thiobacillaceae bacterium]HNI07174.1 putative O-glycosylation ligase, exosortase A system-associated [Thiobacillaceae bacterium]